MPKGAVVETQPVPALDAAQRRGRAGAVSRRAAAGAADVFGAEARRPPALRAGAQGHRSGARRAHHRDPRASSSWRCGPDASIWSASAPRAPTSGCSARTLPARSARCGHLTRLRRGLGRAVPRRAHGEPRGGAGRARTTAPGCCRRTRRCGHLPPCALDATQAVAAAPRAGRAGERSDGAPSRAPRCASTAPARRFLGSGEVAARRPAAAAPPDRRRTPVSLCFAETFSVEFAPAKYGQIFTF